MSFNPYMLLILLSAVIASLSQILLKKSAQRRYESVIREYLNPFVITGYALLVITTLLNILAYSRGVELKSGAVIETMGLVFVMLLSRLIFKESITTKKLVGVCLIIIGIVIFHT